MSAAPVAPNSLTEPKLGFWRRRVLQPIKTQVTQGVAPDQIAAAVAVGTACGLLPIFGVTSIVTLAVGVALRMNQPILQAVSQLLGAMQIALLLVYVRIGEVIWRSTENHFTLKDMIRDFRDRSLWDFLQQFGWAGVHALTAWLLTSPLLIAVIYFVIRPAVRRAARRKAK